MWSNKDQVEFKYRNRIRTINLFVCKQTLSRRQTNRSQVIELLCENLYDCYVFHVTNMY